MSGDLAQVQLAGGDLLGHALGIQTGLDHGVTDVPGSAHGQQGILQQMIHHHVGHGDIHIVHTVDAQQAADSALHGNRGVLVDESLRIGSHTGGRFTGLGDQFQIQTEFAFHISNYLFNYLT